MGQVNCNLLAPPSHLVWLRPCPKMSQAVGQTQINTQSIIMSGGNKEKDKFPSNKLHRLGLYRIKNF